MWTWVYTIPTRIQQNYTVSSDIAIQVKQRFCRSLYACEKINDKTFRKILLCAREIHEKKNSKFQTWPVFSEHHRSVKKKIAISEILKMSTRLGTYYEKKKLRATVCTYYIYENMLKYSVERTQVLLPMAIKIQKSIKKIFFARALYVLDSGSPSNFYDKSIQK